MMSLTGNRSTAARATALLESIWHDSLYGVRSLRRQPAITLAAILTLGLGIGFNTSVFTVFNALALRPWPVSAPDRMVCLLSAAKNEMPVSRFPLAGYRYLAASSTSFSGLIATRPIDVQLGEKGASRECRGVLVTANYFQVLGVSMQLGRSFEEEDSEKAVVILSYRLWKSWFAGNQVVGDQLHLDGVPFTVVGVASREFIGSSADGQDLWIPEGAEKLLLPPGSPVAQLTRRLDYENWAVAGRLSEGVFDSQAQAEINLLNRQFRNANSMPPTDVFVVGTSLFSSPAGRAEILPIFALMFAGVVLVLLLASANVGNLLLARAASRQRETAARLALGASRSRLVRQLLTESMLLALAGGGVGILLAAWLPRLILAAYLGESLDWIKPDLRVLLFTLLASVVACFVFGLAPALHATKMSLADAVKAHHSRLMGRYSLRSALLAAQVAISVVLLVSAGLLVRGVEAVASRETGFHQTGVTWARIGLPANQYDANRTRRFMEQLRAEAAASGLWDSVAVTAHVPLGPGLRGLGINPAPGSAGLRMALSEEVSPEYFQLLGIPILSGRNFGPADRGRNVILVNEAMARRMSPDRSPIGSMLSIGRQTREVIGIVRDAHTADLYRVEPTLYQPFGDLATAEIPFRSVPSLLLKSDRGTSGDKVLRALATRLEPSATVQTQPLARNVDTQLRPSRLGAAVAGTFGLVALFLAAVGLFGVFAYSVRRQSREIATRMALGARPAQIVCRVLLSTSRPAGAGLLVGFFAAVAASRLLEIHLYGISRMEPYTYLAVMFLVAISGMAASMWPAWMITRVEPSTALRSE